MQRAPALFRRRLSSPPPRAGRPSCPTHAPTPQNLTPQGIISRESLRLAAALRASGARFAIVSGARTTTVLQRLPFLPAADAVVSENGGRIFYPDPDGLTGARRRWRLMN